MGEKKGKLPIYPLCFEPFIQTPLMVYFSAKRSLYFLFIGKTPFLLDLD